MKTSIKKLNAGLGLLAVVLLVVHVIYQVVSYLMRYYNPVVTKVLGYSFAAVIVVHIILSVISVYGRHDTASMRHYPGLNIRTVLQRSSGMLIILLLFPHIKTGDWVMGPRVGEAGFVAVIIAEILFFAAVLTHVGTSLTRALISLGWLSSRRTQRRLDVIFWIICAIGFVLALLVVVRTQSFLYHMPS